MKKPNMNNFKNADGIMLVAISAASYGIMPIFAKIAYATGSSTYTLLFLRFLIGAVFMLTLMFVKRLPLPSGKEILAFLLLGGIGYTGQSFCYFTALKYTTAGTVSLLLYTYPTLVTVGSVLFLKERLTIQKFIALLLALIGSLIIIGDDFYADLTGILLAIGAAVIYTSYILVSSRVVKEGMGIQSSAFVMTGTAVVYGLMNVFTGFSPPTQMKGYIATVLIALISTVLAVWAFFTGLEKVGPSTASIVSTLEPVVTVLASVFILSEKLMVNTLIGGILIIMALFVTLLHKNKI
jgi:drug/metabolite transporter (DMT)-like permease